MSDRTPNAARKRHLSAVEETPFVRIGLILITVAFLSLILLLPLGSYLSKL